MTVMSMTTPGATPMDRIGRFYLSVLENSYTMGNSVNCGEMIRKRACDMAIADNRGYIKRDNSGLFRRQKADGAAMTDNKCLSLCDL